jgi:DNA-directed RNA polymerase subunit RPC12/RpoP
MNNAELIKALRCDKEDYGDCNAEKPCEYQRGASVNYCDYRRLLHDAADAIEELQAQIPKRGEWKHIFGGYVECSECGASPLLDGEREYVETNYCPNCGAKMDLKEKNDEQADQRHTPR